MNLRNDSWCLPDKTHSHVNDILTTWNPWSQSQKTSTSLPHEYDHLFKGWSILKTVHSRSCPNMYISNVYNTWTLNTQTLGLIKCIDLSFHSTLYITHTQPLPILSWHSFFKVPPLWNWFQTQGCIHLYNWDLFKLLSWLTLNKLFFYMKVYRMVYRCCFSNRCSSTGSHDKKMVNCYDRYLLWKRNISLRWQWAESP